MRLSEGKNLSLLQIASTTPYCFHSVIINVTEINRNQSLIVLQKYGSMYSVYVTIILVNCRDDKLKRCCVDCHKSILNVHGDELSNIIKLFGAYNWR